jgi:hypothetical protein
VDLEVKIKTESGGFTIGQDYQRIGPIERIRDQLDELECYSCVRERDPTNAYPWSSCVPAGQARWYASQSECAQEAEARNTRPDAGSSGHEFQTGMACELSEEGVQAGDAEDEEAYDAANARLESALAAARRRVRSFQAALSSSRQIFERADGRCQAWDLRQDPGSASGWISRKEALDPGTQQLSEFRFSASAEAVRLTGWIMTALPSTHSESGEMNYGPLCEDWTTLVDASSTTAKFTYQVWFFSRTACEKGASEVGRDAGWFGPQCNRVGQ